MTARKTRPGRVVASLEEAISLLRQGAYLYIGRKAYDPRWIINFTLARLAIDISYGNVRTAVMVDDPMAYYTAESPPECLTQLEPLSTVYKEVTENED